MFKELVEKLIGNNVSISVAESVTGGSFSREVTLIPNSSKVFLMSVVSYSNQSKIKILNVKKETIENEGIVSKKVAFEMALGVKKISKSDVSISFTGNAGPSTQENSNKGETYICLLNKENEPFYKKLSFTGERVDNINKIVIEGCKFLLEKIV